LADLPPPAPYYTAGEIAWFRSAPSARHDALPPLALKMCAGCTAQYAVEGDAGDEQGGTAWFGPCCPTPPKYANVFIIEASKRMPGGVA
jgi:hypothetical protein